MSAKIIVIGNEKGGSGKSTMAMHLIVSWLRQGKKVASIDLDGRQGTLSHYIENRKKFMSENGLNLPVPYHVRLKDVSNGSLFLRSQLEQMKNNYDIIVLDTPGTDSPITAEALSYADILFTPINDSLIDLDVFASIDEATMSIKKMGAYAERIWAVRQKRSLLRRPTLVWMVARNRLSPFNNKNEKVMEKLLTDLEGKINFKVIGGVSERIIYRELFLKGLTMLDIKENGIKMPLSMSALAGRQEMRSLALQIGL